jgi:hypothetical protein
MSAVTMRASGFERPAKFDLAAHWAKATAELEGRRRRFSVVLALAPAAAQMLGARCPTSPVANPESMKDLPEGWVTLMAEFEDEEFARFVVLGLGARARAIEPHEFCDKIGVEIKAMAGRNTATVNSGIAAAAE